jgi:hypothetical protein
MCRGEQKAVQNQIEVLELWLINIKRCEFHFGKTRPSACGGVADIITSLSVTV